MASLDVTWDESPSHLPTVLDRVKREHAGRTSFDRMLLRLCYQRPYIADTDAADAGREIAASSALKQLGFNTCRKVIDAARSRICRPLRPVVMPVGADRDVERTCTILSRSVDGIMDVSKYWGYHAPKVFDDACKTTMGILEWYVGPVTGEISCERGDRKSVV
jgi:hypothetical protein